jgi:hypothetical protein
MPGTFAWQLLMAAAHDRNGEPPTAAVDQLDATLRDFAVRMGFTLDRPTLEAALFGMALAIGYGTLFDDSPDDTVSDENVALGLRIGRYILVERIDGMGS